MYTGIFNPYAVNTYLIEPLRLTGSPTYTSDGHVYFDPAYANFGVAVFHDVDLATVDRPGVCEYKPAGICKIFKYYLYLLSSF